MWVSGCLGNQWENQFESMERYQGQKSIMLVIVSFCIRVISLCFMPVPLCLMIVPFFFMVVAFRIMIVPLCVVVMPFCLLFVECRIFDYATFCCSTLHYDCVSSHYDKFYTLIFFIYFYYHVHMIRITICFFNQINCPPKLLWKGTSHHRPHKLFYRKMFLCLGTLRF